MNKAQIILNIFNEKRAGLSYDLDKEFDWINKTLFNNEIIKPPILTYKTNKKNLGLTHLEWKENICNITRVEISDSYDLTLQQFRSVLAHEMLHVLQGMKNHREEAHGSFFIRMMNQYNKKIMELGIENEISLIRKTEDAKEINTFEDDKLSKKVGVVTLINKNGLRMCVVFNLDVLLVNKASIIDSIKKYYGDNESDIKILKSDNGILKKYKITTKSNTFTMVDMSDKEFDILIKDSEDVGELGFDVSNMPKFKKPLGVILLRKPDGKTTIGVYDLEGMKENISYYVDKFTYAFKKNFEVSFLSSDNFLLSNYSVVKKKIKDIKMYSIEEGKYNDILKSSTIIDKIIL